MPVVGEAQQERGDIMLIPERLEPEQNAIKIMMSDPQNPAELILVQGVAGAGKTALGLFALLDVVRFGEYLLRRSDVTPVFVTYNELLLEECYTNLLRDGRLTPDFRSWISDLGTLTPYRVNFITFQQICKLLASLEVAARAVEDRDAIGYVADIAAKRGFGDLPPEQVFAQLSCLLKGHSHLRDMGIQEMLNAQASDALLAIFGHELIRIRNLIQGEYQDRLSRRNQLDRIDLAIKALDELRSDEDHLQALLALQPEEVRRRLQAGNWSAELEWLRRLTDALPGDDPDPQVHEFTDLARPVVRERRPPSNANWQRIQQVLVPVLVKRGFHGTRAFDSLGHLLPKPFFIVDEAQDLSLTESELLISLWFHLERGHYSHLVILGDLNQQMMPTGFRWEDLLQQFEVRWNMGLGKPGAQFDANAGWTEYYLDFRRPFRLLLYNFRTSEEIAKFARFVAERLVERVANSLAERLPDLAEHFRERFQDNLIDPHRSIPFVAAEEYGRLPPEQRLVWIIVADRNIIVQALDRYEAHGGLDERLVLIVHDRELLQQLMEPARIQRLDNHVRVLGAIWSKGLEFTACAVAGVPMAAFGDDVTVDQIGQLYTSVTRAQIKLRLLVSAQDWQNQALQALFAQVPPDCATVVNVLEVGGNEDNQVEYLLMLLEKLGPARVSLPARIRYADQMAQKFRDTHDEEFILVAIAEVETIGESGKAFECRQLAARTFEEDRKWRLAIRYYEALRDDIGRIRCLYGLSQDDRESDEQRHQVMQQAEELCQRFERAKQWGKAAEAWVILREFEKAIAACIEHGREWWAARVPGARVAAHLAAVVDDPLRKAEDLVAKLSEKRWRHQYVQIAQEYQKRGTDEERVRGYLLLERHGLDEETARLLEDWIGSQKFDLVVKALVASGKLDKMRTYANRLKYSQQPPWEWCAELYVQSASGTSVAQEPEVWQADVREACEAWRKATRPRQLQIMEFLGENLDRGPNIWDREGIRAWVTHLGDNAKRYGLDNEAQRWVDLIAESIPSDRQLPLSLHIEQIARVREHARHIELVVCNSEAWLSDLRKYAEEWLRTLSATGILSAQDDRAQEAKRLLDALVGRPSGRRVAGLSERATLLVDLRSHLLRLVAAVYSEAIARFVHETVLRSAHPDRHVLGCDLLFYTARREAEARSYAERLWRSRKPEERLDTLRCWLAMGDMNTARTYLLREAANLDEKFAMQAAGILSSDSQEQERFRHLMDAERLWASDQPNLWPTAMEHWRQAGWGPQAEERLRERIAQGAIPTDLVQRCLAVLWPGQPARVQEALASLSSLPLLLRPEADSLTEIAEGDRQEAFEYVIERVRHSLLEAEDIDHLIRELEYARSKLAKGDYSAAQTTCEALSNQLASSHPTLADYVGKIARVIAKQGATASARLT
jgi:hypothetical protein